jgi:hypothetical protein
MFDGHLVRQVELLVAATYQVGIASLEEVIPNSGTHKAVVSRYIYFTVFV